MSAAAPDLVLAGNLLVDDIVCRDGRTRMGEAGGAALFASLGAALWGVRTAVVSVAGSDYPAAALAALAARDVDLAGVRRNDGPGVRTWLLEEERGRRVLHHEGRPSHTDVSPRPDDIPARLLEARAFHLGPMPLESQHALVSGLRQKTGGLVAIDPHVRIAEQTFDAWARTLLHVDVLFASEDELELEPRDGAEPACLPRLASTGPRAVAFRRGARGGVLYERDARRFLPWSASPDVAVDTTGAGDAFAGGYLAGLLETGSFDDAVERGVVSASFAIEDWGARGLLAATRTQAERRRERWFGAESRR